MISTDLYNGSLKEILTEVENYILATYGEHYVGANEIQTIDFFETLGNLDTTARDNCIKYLSRFGKKDGNNKKDLLKAFHYLVIYYHLNKDKFNTQ